MGRPLEACGVCFTGAGISSPYQDVNLPASSAGTPGQEQGAGAGSADQWKGVLQPLRTTRSLSHHLLPSPRSFFPHTCSHLPSHSYFSHQHSATLSPEIIPSLLPLGSKAQRSDSLAWRHTASLLPGPVSILRSCPLPHYPSRVAASSSGESQGSSSFSSSRGEMVQPFKMTMFVLLFIGKSPTDWLLQNLSQPPHSGECALSPISPSRETRIQKQRPFLRCP